MAAVVVAIYSTLGIAPETSRWLRDRGLVDAVFGAGALAILIAVLLIAIRPRPRWSQLGVLLGVIAAYVMVLARMAIPEERTHLVEYGVVAALVHAALVERRTAGGRVPAPWLLATVGTAIVGVLDECIQALLPDRVFDLRDVGFNVVAAAMAVAAGAALRRTPRADRPLAGDAA